mmetsp:Transcript_14489/g.49484  ORF Transcript_14489/g.49484 Transcript_14489/m.49484 type:complete len:108 (-) Transcript_14489:14-337(-)
MRDKIQEVEVIYPLIRSLENTKIRHEIELVRHWGGAGTTSEELVECIFMQRGAHLVQRSLQGLREGDGGCERRTERMRSRRERIKDKQEEKEWGHSGVRGCPGSQGA